MRYITIRKFTLDSMLMGIAMFCVFSYALLENASVSLEIISQLKNPLLVTGALSLILMMRVYIDKLTSKKYFATFSILFLIVILLLWIMYMNRDPIVGSFSVRGTFRLILFLIDLFILVVVAAEQGRSQSVLRFLYWYLLILMIINDTLMFSRVLTFVNGRHETYIVGTKFSVSYLHMNFLTLWMMNNKKTIRSYRFSLWKVWLAAIYIIAVSIRVNCMTGILGCVMLVLLFILIESPSRGKLLKFTTPGMLLAFFAGSVLFAFIAEVVLSIPVISYLVKNVFGRDLSLTGRTSIYMMYTQTIPGHWMTGYGYGNAYEVTTTLFGFDNVQNALLQWVLQIGIIATAALIILMMQIFSRISWKNPRNMPQILLLVALIYTYIILGAIETTLNMAFVTWFALIFMLVNERTPALKRGTRSMREE